MRHTAPPSASDPVSTADPPSVVAAVGDPPGSGPDAHPEFGDAAAGEAAAGDAARRQGLLRMGIGAVVALLIAAAVVGVLVSAAAQQGSSVAVPTAAFGSSAPAGPSTAPATAGGQVLVHVTGAVHRPGLVALAPGSRVVDAVAAAGGLAEDANPAGVNLARPVADGEQLAVPKVGDPPAAGAASGAGVGGAAGGAGAASGGGASAGAPVNLNTATEAELETLPRIGPALAQRILDWRQANGRFAQISDLMKVSGIGQKLFDGLKDRVVV
jgi:competence protein ComEA